MNPSIKFPLEFIDKIGVDIIERESFPKVIRRSHIESNENMNKKKLKQVSRKITAPKIQCNQVLNEVMK